MLLGMALLSACEKAKPDVELPLPSEPPNPAMMQPTSDPQ